MGGSVVGWGMQLRINSILILSAATIAAGLALAAPASAGCKDNVPSGNAEVDQYSEWVPGSCGKKKGTKNGGGNRGGSGSGGSGSGSGLSGGSGSGGQGGGSPLSAETVSQLESLGPDGAAAARLAAANAPAGGVAGSRGGGDRGAAPFGPSAVNGFGSGLGEDGTSNGTGVAGETGGSALAALANGLVGDRGGAAGIALPLLLIAILVGAAVWFLRRRRSSLG
jgi:hypothetical protein